METEPNYPSNLHSDWNLCTNTECCCEYASDDNISTFLFCKLSKDVAFRIKVTRFYWLAVRTPTALFLLSCFVNQFVVATFLFSISLLFERLKHFCLIFKFTFQNFAMADEIHTFCVLIAAL